MAFYPKGDDVLLFGTSPKSKITNNTSVYSEPLR